MDQTIIDVSDLKRTISPGDHVVLIGTSQADEITASEFSELAGTIPWEALCSITKRVVRIYVGSREI
jgi:alanine racemase